MRVLLVDDDTEPGELVREYLAREGFALEVEADGTRAVERAVAGDYQLLVLDVLSKPASYATGSNEITATP